MAANIPSQQSKNDMNFDLNLVPFIDVLSTCICFLLLTSIWIHIGTMDVTQAVGDEMEANGKNPASVWATVRDGDVKLTLKDVEGKLPENLKTVTLRAQGKEIDWQRLGAYIDSLKAQLPNVKTVLIMPDKDAEYGSIIKMMDEFKSRQISQIGISPL